MMPSSSASFRPSALPVRATRTLCGGPGRCLRAASAFRDLSASQQPANVVRKVLLDVVSSGGIYDVMSMDAKLLCYPGGPLQLDQLLETSLLVTRQIVLVSAHASSRCRARTASQALGPFGRSQREAPVRHRAVILEDDSVSVEIARSWRVYEFDPKVLPFKDDGL